LWWVEGRRNNFFGTRGKGGDEGDSCPSISQKIFPVVEEGATSFSGKGEFDLKEGRLDVRK